VPKKAKQDDEQIVLLREILAELRRLNANLEKRQQAGAAPEVEDAIGMEDEEDDEDSEELEYFE
jgi:hypothetical protein